MPAALDLRRLHFTFSHPDFLDSIDAVNVQPKATPEQLRRGRGVIVLRRGISVTGRVLDRDGHPIAGASVRLGNRFWKPATKTETEAGSASGKPPPTETLLTVQAAGHAPEARPVQCKQASLQSSSGSARAARSGGGSSMLRGSRSCEALFPSLGGAVLVIPG